MCTGLNPSDVPGDTGATWIILAPHNKAVRLWIAHREDGDPLQMGFAAFSLDSVDLLVLEGGHPLDDWAIAEPEMTGTLKWDGCIDWQTGDEGFMHGCGPGHIVEVADILSTVYHVGKRHMSLLDEDVPAMPQGAIEILEGTSVATPIRQIAG